MFRPLSSRYRTVLTMVGLLAASVVLPAEALAPAGSLSIGEQNLEVMAFSWKGAPTKDFNIGMPPSAKAFNVAVKGTEAQCQQVVAMQKNATSFRRATLTLPGPDGATAIAVTQARVLRVGLASSGQVNCGSGRWTARVGGSNITIQGGGIPF